MTVCTLTQEEILKQNHFRDEIIPHMDALYSFAFKYTSNPVDAEELVQNTIIKAYHFFEGFKRGTNGKAWLFRILINTHINEYRKKLRKPNHIPFDEELTPDETEITNYFSNEFLIKLFEDDIYKALKKLPEDFRIVTFLCDVKGFTYEEMANMLDVPIGTIRSRLHRGRKLLKIYLHDYGKKRGYGIEQEN